MAAVPVIDEADIPSRAAILADFIGAAGTQYKHSRAPIAIGFSNGAIMAAALLLTLPRLLAGALFRPLSPLRDDLPTRLDRTPVLIIVGEKDSRRASGDGARLAERLTHAGATVTACWTFDYNLGSRDCSELVGANATIEMRWRPASGPRAARPASTECWVPAPVVVITEGCTAIKRSDCLPHPR